MPRCQGPGAFELVGLQSHEGAWEAMKTGQRFIEGSAGREGRGGGWVRPLLRNRSLLLPMQAARGKKYCTHSSAKFLTVVMSPSFHSLVFFFTFVSGTAGGGESTIENTPWQ